MVLLIGKLHEGCKCTGVPNNVESECVFYLFFFFYKTCKLPLLVCYRCKIVTCKIFTAWWVLFFFVSSGAR